jgi:putative oxidoreductase
MALPSSRAYFPALDRSLSALTPLGETLLRVVTGGFLVPHGAQKLFGAFEGPGMEGTTGFMASLGFTPPGLWAYLLALGEFGGGILLAIGLFTRLGALAAAILLFVATFTVHWPNGFFAPGGFEYPMLWAFAALYFVFRGSNRYSVDAAIGRTL